MPTWDAELYLRFGRERTQAAIDLAARIDLAAPARVIDLGCGPGNSTAVLRARFPHASITGLDSSAEMLAAAQRDYPDHDWIQASIADWSAGVPYDVVYSNAALQWVHGHATLIPHLFEQVAVGGALAVQVPSHFDSALHRRMHEISLDPRWSDRMSPALKALVNHKPEFYYDLLGPRAARVDLWLTDYVQPMASHAAIVEWIRGTGLRPYFEALSNAAERNDFTRALERAIAADYPVRPSGGVLFPFRRLFFIAYRRAAALEMTPQADDVLSPA